MSTTSRSNDPAASCDELVVQVGLLLSAGPHVSRSTDVAPALNLLVSTALQSQSGERATPAAWRLVELAVVAAEPSSDQENPLLAARYLLALGDLPTSGRDLVYVTGRGRSVPFAEVMGDNSHSRSAHVDLEKRVGQRRALAGTTSTRWITRTNWLPEKEAIAATSRAFADRVQELLKDESVLAELHHLDSPTRKPESSAEKPQPPLTDEGFSKRGDAEPPTDPFRTMTSIRRLVLSLVAVVVGLGAIWLIRANNDKQDASEGLKTSSEAPFAMNASVINRTSDDRNDDFPSIEATVNDELEFWAEVKNTTNETIGSSYFTVHVGDVTSASDDMPVVLEIVEDTENPHAALVVGSVTAPPDSNCVLSSRPQIDRISTVESDETEIWSDSLDLDNLPSGILRDDFDTSGADLQVDWEPGETRRFKVVLKLLTNDYSAVNKLGAGGDSFTIRHPGEKADSTTVLASAGDELLVTMRLHDTSCSTSSTASSPLLQVRASDDPRGFTTVRGIAKDTAGPGQEDAVTLETALVNYIDGKRHKLIPLSNTTELFKVEPSKCDSLPKLDRTLPDGIMQGGIQSSPLYGYTPREKCWKSNLQWIRFRVRVE